MAVRTQQILVDDLDGGDAEETVEFALDGVTYEIDLSATNAEALREALALYVGHATRTGGRRRTGRNRAAGSAGVAGSNGGHGGGGDAAQIRAWASEHGLSVNARGRIPAEIVAQYEAAHN